MKIVAIKKCSEGNDSVGDMWTETKIFEPTATLADVMGWISNGIGGFYKKDITLTVADEKEAAPWEQSKSK